MAIEKRPDQLIRDVAKNRPFPPVMLLFGPDGYTRDRLLSQLIEVCLPNEKDRVFGLEEYEANEVEPSRLLGVLKTIPFGLPRKVVVLRRFELMATSVKKAERSGREGSSRKIAPLEEGLIRYFQHPSERTILLISSSLELKRNHPFFRALPNEAVLVPCLGLKGRDALGFVRARLQEMGKTASNTWIEQFVEMCGEDARKLTGELEKITLFAGDRDTLKEEDLEIVSAAEFSRDVFALLDAIVRKKPAMAVEVIREILASGDPPLRVLSTLLWHYRLVAKAHRLKRMELEGKVMIHPSKFVARKISRHARNLSFEKLMEDFGYLREADRELKGSRLPPPHIMETLIYRLSR